MASFWHVGSGMRGGLPPMSPGFPANRSEQAREVLKPQE